MKNEIKIKKKIIMKFYKNKTKFEPVLMRYHFAHPNLLYENVLIHREKKQQVQVYSKIIRDDQRFKFCS